MVPKKGNKKAGQVPATTFHAKKGNVDMVIIDHLRVLVSVENDCWFAEGLEIDYYAEGKSLQEVKSNFSFGLTETISAHLKIHGNLEQFLKPAPIEVWKEFLVGAHQQRFDYSHGMIQITRNAKASQHQPHRKASRKAPWKGLPLTYVIAEDSKRRVSV